MSAMGDTTSDHDLLIRIDERTADMAKQLGACTVKIDDHEKRIGVVETKTANGNGNGKTGLLLALIKASPWAVVALAGLVLAFMYFSGEKLNVPGILP